MFDLVLEKSENGPHGVFVELRASIKSDCILYGAFVFDLVLGKSEYGRVGAVVMSCEPAKYD